MKMPTIPLILSLIFAMLSGCSTVKPTPATVPTFAYLKLFNKAGEWTGHCSGSAVGPHLILTATHCLDDVGSMEISGHPAKVLEITSDTSDHSIVEVDATFLHWSSFGAKVRSGGHSVYIEGNPGSLENVYRDGTWSAIFKTNGKDTGDLYNLQIFPGDSGSGIYDKATQKIVGVVSFVIGYTQVEPSGLIQFQMTYAPSFSFTEAQACHLWFENQKPNNETCKAAVGLE